MAVTISRTAWTDDDGSGTTGTVINNALKTSLYDEIDAMLATVFTSTTVLKSTVVGSSLTSVGVLTSLTVSGTAYIGDTSNAKATLGLTINQGAADDEALAIKSSDVAHGMTDFAETDTYCEIKKIDAANGGALLRGFSGGSYGAMIIGEYTTDTATRSTAGIAPILFDVNLKNGTSHTSPAADKNIVVFQAGGTTRFILDSDGDSHQDVGTAWTNFDAEDDVALLHALSVGVSRRGDPIRAQFGSFLSRHRRALERAHIVTFNRDGHHFINWSRAHMLTIGAVRQLSRKVEQQGCQLRRLMT